MSRSRISNVEDYLDNEIVFYMPRIDLRILNFSPNMIKNLKKSRNFRKSIYNLKKITFKAFAMEDKKKF